ncbi:MAG: hypothetical protein AB1589_35235 [Cyanobacteriota bacterium]
MTINLARRLTPEEQELETKRRKLAALRAEQASPAKGLSVPPNDLRYPQIEVMQEREQLKNGRAPSIFPNAKANYSSTSRISL